MLQPVVIGGARVSLSARSGERAGPIAKRWEGEVVDRMRSTSAKTALAICTHISIDRMRSISSPASGRRGLSAAFLSTWTLL